MKKKNTQICGLTAFAWNLLAKAENLDEAISTLLERVGKTYGLDRVTVMEIDDVYLSGTFPYQWSRGAKDLFADRKVYMDQEVFRQILEEKTCLRQMYLGGQVEFMPACMHAVVRAKKAYIGVLILERRAQDLLWTEEERKQMKELSATIGSFLMKVRSDAMSRARMDFVSRMSHEIRTPMNAIAGMTAIAKRKAGDRDAVLECLHKIEAANSYLEQMVNNIFDMSGMEADRIKLQYQPVEIEDVLDGLNRLLRLQARKQGVTFAIENRCPQGQGILADPVRINQILTDMVRNAFRLAGSGGGVVLEVRPMRSNRHSVTLAFSIRMERFGVRKSAGFVQQEANWSENTVDFGILEESGVGISISRRLIDLMGGTLEIWKSQERRILYYVTLPFCLEAVTSEADAMQAEGQHVADRWAFQGERILIVEDNEVNREILETLLQLHGLTTECAANGKEGVERFLSRTTGYYAGILMDIRMPVMDGLEATRRIRTSGHGDARTVPIIAVTGNSFDEDTERDIVAGMDGYLKKPIQVDPLLELLHKVCKSEGARKEEK